MENVDMFNAATAPLTFHDFLDRMRHPSAADLVRGIKSFIVSFSSNAPDPENDSRMVQDFLTRMEAAFKAHPLWAGATEDELDSAGEGLEKYLMTKLVNRAFAPTPADAKHDQELSEKISLVQQFIRPEHLDILPNYQNETSWLLAQKELQKINTYKAPRDKLVCILNCCRVINNLLLNVSMATNDNPPGADDFLPVLIYVTIKANPPQLHSNLLYIQRYRQPSRLVSEAAYFFTNMVSAESFISNIDAKSLSMDEDEFERNMTAARFALHSGQSTVEAWNFTSDSTVPKAQVPKLQKKEGTELALPAVSENRANRTLEKGTTFIRNTGKSKDGNVKENLEGRASTLAKIEIKGAVQVLQADRTGKLKREYPFLYARAGDLTVGDVELLLNAYKELVLKYVSLSKAVESSLLPNTHSAFEGDAGSKGINSIVSKYQNNQQVGSSADLSEANEGREGSQINKFNHEMKNIDQQVSSSADLSATNEASEGSHINNSNREMKNSDEDGLQFGTATDHHESLFLSTRSVNTDGELHASNRTETIEMEQFNTLQHAGGSRVDQASEEVTDGDIMAALDSEQSSVAPAEMLLSKDASPNDHEREGL